MTDRERYYDRLWTSGAWGTSDLNADERLRLGAIVGLLQRNGVLLSNRRRPFQILDVGCGRGWLTQQLAGYGDVLGVDTTPVAVARAQTLFPEIEFRVAIPEDLLTSPGGRRYDLIVASEVIEHVENGEKESFLAALRDLLVPGGYLVLTTPRGELWYKWKRLGLEEQPVEQWISEEELARLAVRLGLRVADRARIFLPGLWPGATSRVLSSRAFRWLVRAVSLSRLLAGYDARQSIYQVILLQRDLDGAASRAT